MTLISEITVLVRIDPASSGQIIAVDPQIESITGYTPVECMAMPSFWTVTVHPDDFQELSHWMEKAFEKQERLHAVFRMMTKSDSMLWIDLLAFPESNDRVPGLYQGILTDVTRQKKSDLALQQKISDLENRLSGIKNGLERPYGETIELDPFTLRAGDTVKDMLFVFDLENRRFTYINRPMADLGYSLDELNNMAPGMFGQLLHPDELLWQPERINRLKRMKSGEIVNFDYRIKFGTGEWHNIQAVLTGFVYSTDGKLTQIIGSARDITVQIQTEKALRQNTARAEALARLASRLNGIQKPDALIHALCEEVSRALDVPAASVTLSNRENTHFYLAGSVGLPAGFNQAVRSIMLQALPEWLLAGDMTPVALDLASDVDFPDYEVYKDYQICRMAVANMIHDGEMIGYLTAMLTDNDRQFNPDELVLFRGMADQAALAFSNAWQIEEVDQRAIEFSTLYQISVELAEQHDLPAIYQLIAERSLKLLRASSSAIFLYDQKQKDLEVVCAKGKAVGLHTRIHMGEGIVGSAAMTGQLMVVNGFAAHEKKTGHLNKIPALAVIAAPMLYSGDLIGILAIFEETDSQHRFYEKDGHLLMLMAGQLASAVHNTRLFEETSERAAQLTLLYDAGLALNSELEPKAQLEFLLKIAMEALHADRAVFYRYIDVQDEYRVELGLGYNAKVMEQMTHTKISGEDDYCLVGWVGKNRLPINVTDTYKDPRYIIVDPEIRSMVLASVEHEDHLLGVLAMSGLKVNAFNPQAERLLNLYANEVAVAMENARLFNEAQSNIKRSQSLRSIDLSITANFNLQNTFDIMLDQFIDVLKIDAVDVLLINPSSQTLNYVAGRGFRTAALHQTHLKIGSGPAGKAALDRRILLIPDLENEPDWYAHAPQLVSEGFVSYFAVPFKSKGLVKGVLEIYSRNLMTPDRDWLDFLESLERQLTIAIENASLFDELRQSNDRLTETYDETLEAWIKVIDQRDRETTHHTRRVMEKTLALSRVLGFTQEELVQIRRGALLHDLGKIAIPDSILLKPGPLSEDEWALVRKHPIFAYEMIYPIAYLRPALDIPYCHHEKWDGTGYPRGLAASLIPQSARIFSVVDVWESLTSPRPYRPDPWTEEKARQYLIDRSGKDFDPVIVEAFLRLL